jgi:DNA-binding XRE family transcriptional regulator
MSTSEYNVIEHNRKIAKLRGNSWRKALMMAKLNKAPVKTAIKFKRVNLGLSHYDIMPRLGIKHQTIYARIERGDGYANPKQAEDIAKILKSSLDDLFIKVTDKKFLAI